MTRDEWFLAYALTALAAAVVVRVCTRWGCESRHETQARAFRGSARWRRGR